ncbi:hypothetical protein L3073_11105 [Ancylomarina sp. DW003]|nr:hypothetical protein [Ancylomarina sp. DW003]MDE5422756.1 hypothetical protein [Ancylomarina sp. DW003]
MKQARDKSNGEIIDAESLKHIYEDGLSEYECIDEACRIKLLPCSYKPINKVRPYFKSLDGKNHKDLCKFSEYLKLLEKAKNRALTESEMEDMPFPTKFKKVKQKSGEDTIFKSSIVGEEKVGQGGIRKKTSGDFVEIFNKSKVVASISPIVDFYIKCPFNRNVELEIEKTFKMYMYWFKRIEKPLSTGNYKGKRIFFGRLHTSNRKIIETEETLEIALYECEAWEKGGKNKSAVQINPFIVNIDKSLISKNKVTRIKNEIQYAVGDKINAFKDKKKHAYLFFWGEVPTKDEPYKFKVLEGALVARYTQILPTIQ